MTLLDDHHIDYTADITYVHKKGLPFALNLLGFLIGGIGVVLIQSDNIMLIVIGLPLLIAPIAPFTNRYGTEVDSQKNGFREYSQILGIKRGKWFSMDPYPDIALLTIKESVTVGSRTQTASYSENVSGIYLLTANHRRKYMIQRFDTAMEAHKFGEKFAAKFNKNYVKFNPVRAERRR